MLIALVSIGGFATRLAQRRMRSLMFESMGATDRNVRWSSRPTASSSASWAPCRGRTGPGAAGLPPTNEQSAHHVIPTFALPWNVIGPAMVLAVIATFFAAGYPARSITRVPVVSALAGRPAAPRQIRRSLVPGVIAVIGFCCSPSRALAAPAGRGVAGPGLVVDRGDYPRVAVLPVVGAEVMRARRHPPAAARHGALPAALIALGHQPRHHDRGDPSAP